MLAVSIVKDVRSMQGTSPSWRGRWRQQRNRMLSSAGFQRRAIGFPLTRPIAQRRAQQLFDLCAGFVYSQILSACVELDLFERLREGPQSPAVLAEQLKLQPAAMRTLLEAAVSLELLEKSGEEVALGVLGAALLGNPGVVSMVRHHGLLYSDLREPVSLLRGAPASTELRQFWAYARSSAPGGLSARQVEHYTELMSASNHLVADEILDAYPLASHRCLLDVGGGDGSFLAKAAQRNPDLRVVLFDLPAVAEVARQNFAELGLEGRASAVGGDFQEGSLPIGADVISLVRVVHDHDDAEVLSLLVAVRRALPADGRLLLVEPMSDQSGTERMAAAYFGLYLLAMGQGRLRSAIELAALLREAGFARVRLLRARAPLLTRVIVAEVDGADDPSRGKSVNLT